MKASRELTAGVLIPPVIALLVWAPAWAWLALVALVTLVALWEFYGLAEASGLVVPKRIGLALMAAMLLATLLEPGTRAAAVLGLTGTAVLGLPMVVMFSSPPVPLLFPSSAASVLATLYVALPATTMAVIRNDFAAPHGWKLVVLLFAVVWGGDSAAYYVGTRVGKRPLAPAVSPKKTVEGSIGQMAMGVPAGAVAGGLMLGTNGWVHGLVLGFVISVLAQIGDLVESTFKRSAGIKDSGGILPGHGGLLDRLDSLLFVTPAVYVYARWVMDLPRS